MKINLTEIPEEGRSYSFNTQTGELNRSLFDLIGKATHEAEFFLKPLNARDFELTGTIKTKLPEQCARCGIDFGYPIDEKFREFLIPKQDQPRGSKYARVNHLSDLPSDGPETTEYEGHLFDIGEFLHEVIAISAPYNAAGPEDEKGDCSICKIPVRGRSFSYNEELPEEKPVNPFAALKNIKLN